jgi:hypothetical protein
MKRITVVTSIIVLACGILTADEQPGFRNTDLKVVVTVSLANSWVWTHPNIGPAWVADDLLECLDYAGDDDGVSFSEANGVNPNLRIDVLLTQANEGTTQISMTASVSGLGRGHLFNASSGQSPFTTEEDAVQALADDMYSWIHQGWTYPEAPQTDYGTPSYGFGTSYEHRFGVFGLGFSLGRGAGLGSLYASLQPLDLLGIEFDYGTQPCTTPVGPDQITVWPAMLSAKLQFYGGRRSRSSQFGIEAAADWAEQAGWGGHGAFLLRLRPDPHFSVDFNLGAGHFFNPDSAAAVYEERLAKKLGYVPADLRLGFIGQMPNYLVGGIGLSLCF